MSDNRSDLPEGTDTVLEGAANTTGTGADGAVTVEETAIVIDREIIASSDASEQALGDEAGTLATGSSTRLGDRFRSGREQLSSQAGERARGLVTQGLERTAEALANVSRMVGDTANGIEERLGADYGDYARRAASSIENVANSIASKDPDELIDDTRDFVRNSPGIALAGAAVVGFVVARLVKSGLGAAQSGDESD